MGHLPPRAAVSDGRVVGESASSGRAGVCVTGPGLPLPPRRTDKARVCVLNAGSVEMLLASATYGAGLLGHGEAARQALLVVPAALDRGGHRRLRGLLSGMLHLGLPLLVATGMRDRAKLENVWSGIHGHLETGSLLLLVDNRQNVLGVAQPMGRPVYVAAGEEGFLPTEVRHGLDGADAEALTCLQLWVRLLCVADYDRFARDAWFRGGTEAWSRLLNWELDHAGAGGGFKNLKAANATSVLPGNFPVANLFKTRLPELGAMLGDDFAEKLASLRGPLRKPARRHKRGSIPVAEVERATQQALQDPAKMVQQWRRAMLLREVLQHCDDGGRARGELRGVLPDCILGATEGAATLCAAMPVRCGELCRASAADVLALVRGAQARASPTSWRRR